MIVKVTQYMRPDGRQVEHELKIDNECKEKYQQILDCGARLTCEELRTLEISQTIECSDFDFDIVITKGGKLTKNKEVLEKMILRFDKVKCLKQIESFKQSLV